MKQFKTISFLTLSLVLFAACGKSPSQDDRAKDSLRASVLEKEAELTPLAGRYEGTLTVPGTHEIQHVVLQLIPTIMIIQNPGRNDVTEMPTLGGNINVYFNSEDHNDVIPIAQFTNAMYSPSTGHLRLNGTIQTGTAMGNVLNTLDGFISGDVIQGTLSNSSRGELGKLSVKKTSNIIAEVNK